MSRASIFLARRPTICNCGGAFFETMRHTECHRADSAPVSILRKGEIKLKKKYSAEIVMTANTVSGLSLQYIVPLFIIYQIGIILFRGKDNSTNHL